MRKLAPHMSHDLSEESVLGDHLDSLTDALASWVLSVIRTLLALGLRLEIQARERG